MEIALLIVVILGLGLNLWHTVLARDETEKQFEQIGVDIIELGKMFKKINEKLEIVEKELIAKPKRQIRDKQFLDKFRKEGE